MPLEFVMVDKLALVGAPNRQSSKSGREFRLCAVLRHALSNDQKLTWAFTKRTKDVGEMSSSKAPTRAHSRNSLPLFEKVAVSGGLAER